MALFCCALALATTARSAPAVKTLPSPAPALTLLRNSHATAAAWLVKHYGLSRPKESDKALVATAWVYIRRCGDCSDPDSVTWPVAEGLANMLKARGATMSPTETCAKPAKGQSPATFSQLTSAIQSGRPMLVTFCYDPRAAKSAETAKGRARDCLTVAAIGYAVSGANHYVIARDGQQSAGGIAQQDTVAPGSIGLSQAGVWSQPGTRIYKWEGAHTKHRADLGP
jgi:hypothetical protein